MSEFTTILVPLNPTKDMTPELKISMPLPKMDAGTVIIINLNTPYKGLWKINEVRWEINSTIGCQQILLATQQTILNK